MNVYVVDVLHTFLPAKLPGLVHIKPMWHSSLCSLRTKNPRMGWAMFWCCTIFLCTKIKRFCKTKFSLSHCVFPIPLTAVTCFMHQMISGYGTNALRTAQSVLCSLESHSAVLTLFQCLSFKPFSSDDTGKNCSSV